MLSLIHILYGSLAATGKGHMTNVAITETLHPAAPVEIIWEPKIFLDVYKRQDVSIAVPRFSV